ncbi:hypothetical protein SeLEV6574_g02234 [Synchytrium endobioticum]|uniref:F-BAR domain-containing protein n=1 Tax=Synchytrium endobioticum TaxID=286115 RepID=A0A507D9E0_9FUNG|nr:hypothetical protein SeLEV6574_g02234 [Synchytrium endobioticum]
MKDSLGGVKTPRKVTDGSPKREKPRHCTRQAVFYKGIIIKYPQMAAANGAPSFETSFWGDADKGLDQLMSRMRAGKHVGEDLALMLKDRASIEEDYGKKLAKLAKTFSPKEEIGSLRESLDVIQKELEATARVHLDLASAIKVQLERPLNDLVNSQSTIRKGQNSIVERALKTKTAASIQCQRAKERYEARCTELSALKFSQGSTKPDQLDKTRAKIEKTQSAVNQADGDYLSTVEKTRDAFTKWQDDFTTACNVCQKLEQDRIEFLRNSCWNYANLFSKACVQDDEACERIRTSLEKCDIHKDIQAALEKYSTGSSIPAPPSYINYYTSASDRPASIQAQAGQGGSPPPGVSDHLRFSSQLPSSSGSSDQLAAASASSSAEAGDVSAVLYEYNPWDVKEGVPTLFQVHVLYDYASQAFEELSITRGQVVPVIATQDDGWWEGVGMENGKRRKGLFPSNFVEKLTQ